VRLELLTMQWHTKKEGGKTKTLIYFGVEITPNVKKPG